MAHRILKPLLTKVIYPLLVLGSWGVQAQLPLPRLDAVFPPGGQAGTTVRIAFEGEFLELSEVKCSSPTVQVKIEPGAPPQLSISPEAAPGIYELRAVGRFGVSNPRAFVIGRYPEQIEEGSHDHISKAAALPLNVVLNGKSEPNQIDFFKFKADAGVHITITCQAASIDSKMEASFYVTDALGTELARSRAGAPLTFQPATAGEFIVAVHDFLFRGGNAFFYRLQVGPQPHIVYAFPPAGEPGTNRAVTLYGYNLPNGQPASGQTNLQQLSVEVQLPTPPAPPRSDPGDVAAAALDGIIYRLQTPETESNPVFIGSATAPLVVENEPNDQPELSKPVTLPCEIAGRFFPAKDVDCFAFEARKSDVYWIEVISHRLGQPTDPFVLVQRVQKDGASDVKELYDSGNSIGGPEFDTSSRDPSWRFEVNEDGLYRVQIRDLFNQMNDDPTRVYRLSLRREQPDFRLLALPIAMIPRPKDKKLGLVSTSVARLGETVPIRVVAFRQDQLNAPISLHVPNLPPGVKCPDAVIAAGETEAVLLLSAETNAQAWTGSIDIIGTAQNGETKLERQARFGTVKWTIQDANNDPVPARLMTDLLFSVNTNEFAPIDLRAGEMVETSIAGKVQIPLQVARHGDFKETLKVKPYGFKALEKAKEQDVDAKTESTNYELDLTQIKLEPGTYQFYFQTETKGKYRNNPAAAEAAAEAEKVVDKRLEEAKRMAEEAKKKIEEARQAAAAAEARALELKEAAARMEKEAEQASAAVAQVEAEKKTAADLTKAAQEKAKPRDVTFPVYSTPVTLRVTSAPIRLTSESSNYTATAGSAVDVPVRIERLYGFAEAVEIKLRLPEKAKGLKANAATITIPNDQTTGTISVSAESESPVAKHRAVLEAKLKFNGREIKVEQEFGLEVTPAPQPEPVAEATPAPKPSEPVPQMP